MTSLIEQIYAAAANAGFLKTCTWQPSSGAPLQTHKVGMQAHDETVLDNLSLSTEYQMTYPVGVFVGLAAREVVQIDGQQYQVRDIRGMGDGSEMRAKLTRL